MDPYIDVSKLDPGHPLHAAKIDNLRRGDRAHRDRCEEVDALPVKLTLETTDTCNLDCPHCQIPRAEKIPRMDAAVFERVVAELFEWNCDGCGMNCRRSSEGQAVPYDRENFLSPALRATLPVHPRSVTRWSGRMRQFDLTGRRGTR